MEKLLSRTYSSRKARYLHSRHRSQLTIQISMGGTRPQCLGSHSSGNAKNGWRLWRVCRHPSRNRPEHFSSGPFLHVRRQSQLATRNNVGYSCLRNAGRILPFSWAFKTQKTRIFQRRRQSEPTHSCGEGEDRDRGDEIQSVCAH